MPLTNTAIHRFKPKKKPYWKADSNGLSLHVSTAGAKTWKYRFRVDGKENALTLGKFPEMTLDDARKALLEIKQMKREGLDFQYEFYKRKPQPKIIENTFADVAARFFEKQKGERTESARLRDVNAVDMHMTKYIGRYPISELTPPDVLQALRKIEASGTVYTAHKVKQLAGQICRFAVSEGIAQSDPTAVLQGALKKAPKVQHSAHVSLDEAPQLFSDIYHYKGNELTRVAMLLTFHTLCRTGEIRFALKSEFDLEQGLWSIPAERMKMGRDHVIPLTPTVVQLVQDIMGMSPQHKEHLFYLPTRSGTISENRMLSGLETLGYKGRQTVHGFRGLGSTILHEKGYDSAWIEAQLAHADKNTIRASYNKAIYLDQRREMMEWWSRKLNSWTLL